MLEVRWLAVVVEVPQQQRRCFESQLLSCPKPLAFRALLVYRLRSSVSRWYTVGW